MDLGSTPQPLGWRRYGLSTPIGPCVETSEQAARSVGYGLGDVVSGDALEVRVRRSGPCAESA